METTCFHLYSYIIDKNVGTHITPLGKVMAMFPVPPRYARMLSMAHQKNLLEYVIALVAACSVPELFMEGSLGDIAEVRLCLSSYDTVIGYMNS